METLITLAIGFAIAGLIVMVLSGIGLLVAYNIDEPLVGLFCTVLFVIALVITIIAGAVAAGFWLAPLLFAA